MSLFSPKSSFKLKYASSATWRKVFIMTENKIHRTKQKVIFDRSSSIPLTFVGLKTKVYTGKAFHKRLINRWMVGFKFGEFTWNRHLALFKAKKAKKKKK